jgi:hypothetical protein
MMPVGRPMVLAPLILFLAAVGAVAADPAEPGATVRPGTTGPVGCGPDATRVRRLVIDEPGVYENILVDGEWTDGTLVKIEADGVILRRCEIRHGTHNAVTVSARNVVIDSCRIHHVLKGTFDDQQDAHGITGRPTGLVVRNCDIGLVSGDALQFDPGRGPWDDVLIEHCTLWTAPLPADAAGFKKGERPGENALDTKQQTANPRSRVTVRACLMYGWNQPGQIGNMAALNLKNHVEVRVEHCLFRDNENALRIRGGGGELGGARITVLECAVYDSPVALRVEDRPQGLTIRRLGLGANVQRPLRIAGSGSEADHEPLDTSAAPPFDELSRTGLPLGRVATPAAQPSSVRAKPK